MNAAGLPAGDMRWRNYVLTRGAEFETFWQEHADDPARRVLFIGGRGFDPRAALAVEKIARSAPRCGLDILAIEFAEGEANPPQNQKDAAAENWRQLQAIAQDRGTIRSEVIQFQSDVGHRVSARNAANLISGEELVSPYTDVVVDVSAMPRGVYFPLIARVLYFHDALRTANKAVPNVHVLVSEDPLFDSRMKEIGIDQSAGFLHPFEGDFNREALGDNPTVWIPVMGEGRTTQFDRIYDLVKPDEVCPVLPSPSRNPRRGDDIVLEYRKLLFEEARIDPRNILYASEMNPFEVYRQIRKTAIHYHEVLGLIGGCKIALSPLCSKLMSLGVLLTAYEMKTSGQFELGIAHIECQGYELPQEVALDVQQVGLWIAGECYG